MTIFISGGVKNGKSFHAQRLAKALAGEGPLYYLATMLPHDEEDDARILRHQEDRAGMGFETLECARDISGCFAQASPEGIFLLDSTTALLANEMFLPDGNVNLAAAEKIERELRDFAQRVGGLVAVSDGIYSDAADYDALTETYRRGLARIDRSLAQACEVVLEICGGLIICHKGVLEL
jgi:adenosylcobinamide kinase/adenosylcobinamide-phosphate guanylyltransferase